MSALERVGVKNSEKELITDGYKGSFLSIIIISIIDIQLIFFNVFRLEVMMCQLVHYAFVLRINYHMYTVEPLLILSGHPSGKWQVAA